MSESAANGLRYVSDGEPGITRRRVGRGFAFYAPDGSLIKDKATIAWIKSLAVPPAYTDVWISPIRTGHLLATGRDARGRKQYRYHPSWRAVQEAGKFEHMLAFGKALPRLRDWVEQDLAKRELSKDKVCAIAVRLLETTLIRVGNEQYAKDNKNYGLTTMRQRHLAIEGSKLRFSFKGKGGKRQDVTLRDRRLTRLVARLQDLPGQELFQYLDEEGQRHRLDSADVNEYLGRITGQHITAKDFRTFTATVLAAWALAEFERVDSAAAAKRNITAAIQTVAARLGNTPTICRKSYIHPDVLEGYLEGGLVDGLKADIERELAVDLKGLAAEEAVVLAFLQRRLERLTGPSRKDKVPVNA
jgi:DNA topoisomerase-1